MNIKITYNWLLEYLETDASPYEMQKYLSLCGPAIERIDPTSPAIGGIRGASDYVFDIEITSNRIDMASVIGIAQEANAILPMFGKTAKLKFNPLTNLKFKQLKQIDDLKLDIEIKRSDLVSRFTAIVFNKIKIFESPTFIKKYLSAVGVKVINNIVDISNYLMITLGQPIHMFDYDKINGQKMIVRESKKGEKIITLDKKEIVLSGGDIVIEDGWGRLIDLCGIMGGLNSAISSSTKRVVLFVQTYNKKRVRKTVMTTNQRTLAATYFEKGLDEERVEPAAVLGSQLIEKYSQGKIASVIYDIYPKKYVSKKLAIQSSKLEKTMGVKIGEVKIKKILENLGFKVNYLINGRMQVSIPSWRINDIDIAEDIVEEVARIYGYHNLPNNLPPVQMISQDKTIEHLFKMQQKIKYFLKHLGLNEVINYSMVSENLLKEFNLKVENHLKISNTISEEVTYMRQSLIPSLYKNVNDNIGKKDCLKFFEIGKVYLPRKNDLPLESYRLGIAVNTNYFDLKGIIEGIFREFNIKSNIEYKIEEKNKVYFWEIELDTLVLNAKLLPDYQPINPYSVIKLDKTFEIQPHTTYEVVRQLALQSKLLQKIEVVTLYQNKLTLRFYYSSTKNNITEEDAKAELEKIKV